MQRHFEACVRLTVCSGPFSGMEYINRASGSMLYPKLLGTYEYEVHQAVAELVAYGPDLVVDAGAAEGYYAVGLARRLSSAQVVAFEIDEQARDLIQELASKNCVSNLTICGACNTASLDAALRGSYRPAVVMDVEGAEYGLLDPRSVPDLRRSAVLVELHEQDHPDVKVVLSRRFGYTHNIYEYHAIPRQAKDYAYRGWLGRVLPASYSLMYVEEYRPYSMSWLWMVPKR